VTPQLHADFLKRPLAHRALHNVALGRPENSRAAVEAAIAQGYGIEVDVQRSGDNVAMVFHDYWLDRLTEAKGRLDARTRVELTATRLLGGQDGIPTLADVLAIVRGRVPLLIEIKDQDGAMGQNVGPLEAAVARDLEGYMGPVAVMSFNPHSVLEMARLAPQIARGLTTCAYDPRTEKLPPDVCERLRTIPDYDAAGCSFISHDWRDLDAPPVARLKVSGAAILCWTIKTPQDEAQARKIAQNITFEGYSPAVRA